MLAYGRELNIKSNQCRAQTSLLWSNAMDSHLVFRVLLPRHYLERGAYQFETRCLEVENERP